MFDLLSLPIFMNALLHAVLTLPPVLWKPQKGVLIVNRYSFGRYDMII